MESGKLLQEKMGGPSGRSTAHSTSRGPRTAHARIRKRAGTDHQDNGGSTAPARRKVTEVAGLTLPPPTGSRCPPRLGVLAGGRAGTAAEVPGPEESGRYQPWFQPACQTNRLRDRAAQAPPPARREDVARRGGGTSLSPLALPLEGRGLCLALG